MLDFMLCILKQTSHIQQGVALDFFNKTERDFCRVSLGLDPYAGHGEFRLIGLGEVLPISDSSVDAVLFNTSLDHILDYHTAIEEACRVLKPDGRVVIATYAWIERATLLTDSVHFHHFREFEIFGTLERHFEIEDVRRYEDPKHATHRYGLYVMAKRRIE